MEIFGPILGIALFLAQRSFCAQQDELRRALLFKESRLKKQCRFQFQAPTSQFVGVGHAIDPTAVPPLSKEQILSFLVNGYLVVKVSSDSIFWSYPVDAITA
jgi:hypothetical protein